MHRQFIVNAFDRGPFSGNPAAVVPLETWLPDDRLKAIGAQNNLSETAFFAPENDGMRLRWFTPTDEIALCGHATLATAHVIFEELGASSERLEFETLSGQLTVARSEDGYVMDFPAYAVSEADADLTAATLAAAGVDRGEVFFTAGHAFLVLESEAAVRALSPALDAVSELPRGDLLVSAAAMSSDHDICARMFAPGVGIPEDPATGSAHCALAPFWGERLGLETIRSFQASPRGGYITCTYLPEQERVQLVGTCTTFGRGEIDV